MIGLIFTYIPSKRVEKVVSFSLAFSSGVIISICLLDLIPHSSSTLLRESSGRGLSFILLNLFFLLGYFLIFLFKKCENKSPTELYRVGIMSFLILCFHNILEGIATYSMGVYNIEVGLHFCIGIMMHNIPEGILISIPIYYSTKKRVKAFKLVFISSILEPLGALLSYILFKNIYTDVFLSYLMLSIAGLMLSLIIHEIYPEIRKYWAYKRGMLLLFIFGVVFIVINLFIF